MAVSLVSRACNNLCTGVDSLVNIANILRDESNDVAKLRSIEPQAVAMLEAFSASEALLQQVLLFVYILYIQILTSFLSKTDH